MNALECLIKFFHVGAIRTHSCRKFFYDDDRAEISIGALNTMYYMLTSFNCKGGSTYM